MAKKGFKERFAKPWAKGAAFSLIMSLFLASAQFVVQAIGKAVFIAPNNFAGVAVVVGMLLIVPWVGGSLLSWIDKKVNF